MGPKVIQVPCFTTAAATIKIHSEKVNFKVKFTLPNNIWTSMYAFILKLFRAAWRVVTAEFYGIPDRVWGLYTALPSPTLATHDNDTTSFWNNVDLLIKGATKMT